ncbi:MAG: arginine--tRNA ligase [Candidatus Pacearchaeota archaeon]
MKEVILTPLVKILKGKLKEEEILSLVEIPPKEFGDYSFPCFSLTKIFKKKPEIISQEIFNELKSFDIPSIKKIEVKGAYINFFIDEVFLFEKLLNETKKRKPFSLKKIKNKKIVIDFSSPNIAKPFGVGHLRSTIIGNSLANIFSLLGYEVIRINYLGDWGTQFGKLILGYKKWGDEEKLKKNPKEHLLELYIKANEEEYEKEARKEFEELEKGNKKNIDLWKKFREESIKEFNKIYEFLNVSFDEISGESFYVKKAEEVIELLKKKNLLEESEGALIVNLEKFGLGVCLIKKSDGTTLYATRDIAAAIDRFEKYKFSKMIYEVGQEQKLHFKQVFKIIELLGYSFYKDCYHVSHGLYLDKDGKKLSTRKGKTILMEDIINETISLAKERISRREPNLSSQELEERAKKVALAAIVYGDLKNYRENDMIFDIEKFLEFEGNTGPYLLYSYARASSILKKVKNKF